MNAWGLYPWFREDDPALVHPDDLASFVELLPYGKLLQQIGDEGPYLRLAYGTKVFRVKPDLFRSVAVTPMPVGAAVLIIDKNVAAVIEELHWHSKREQPFYLLRAGNKRLSRRYWDDELRALP